jgi:hypothetical protein
MKTLLSLLLLTVLCGTAAFAQTSRTWTGTTSTAWGTASNWSPSGVPATIDHVTIPSTTNKPKLSTNVTVANFSITGGELDLDGDTLTVNGTLGMTGGTVKNGLVKKTSTAAITITGRTLNCELDIAGESLTINTNRFKQRVKISKTGGVSQTMNGNVWEADMRVINTATDANLTLGSTAADTALAHVHLTSSGKGILLGATSGSGNFIVAGNGLQQFVKDGTTVLNGRKVTINKPTGLVLLSGELTITNFLNLTKGIVQCASGAQVTMNSGATASGTSNLSYIEGPVLKKGNQAFTFPVGRNGAYRPISITAPASSTHSFKAEYFESNSHALYSHASKDASLNHLSKNEYWTLTRVVGTSTPKVTLSWDTLTSCIMNTPLSAIHVAGWNGTTWKDLGNGATTGNIHKGTIQTTNAVATFNAFILEHDSGMACRSFGLTWSPATLVIDSTSNFFLTSSNLPYHYTLSLKVEGASYSQYHTFAGLEQMDTVISMIHINDSIGNAEVTMYVVNQWGYKVDSLVYLIPYKRSAQEFECVCEPVVCDHVSNGNFGSFSQLPSGFSQLSEYVDCWGKVAYENGDPEEDCFPIEWYCYEKGHGGTPDYFHVSASAPEVDIPYNTLTSIPVNSVNLTATDNAYSGIAAYLPGLNIYFTEYMTQWLAEPLIQGRSYTMRFYVQVSNRSRYAVTPGVLFTDAPVCQTDWLNIDVPDLVQPNQLITSSPDAGTGYLIDLNEWHLVEIDFIADGAWNHITIGHFTNLPFALGVDLWQTSGYDPLYVDGQQISQCYWFIDEVSLKPNPPTITQGAGLCRTGSPITLNVTGSGTGSNIYTWSASPSDASLIGQENDMEIEVNPSAATTTYTVTVQGPDGCELTDQIIISSDYCCLPSSGSTTYINATLSGTQILTGHFAINGTFTLEPGADITFDGATVNMGPNAEIFLPPTASLTITDDSHIRACDDMWYQIYVSNNASITVNGQSKIEDALNGIHMEDGADFIIDGAIFNRNLIHLYIRAPFISPVYSATTVKNSKFLCQTTASIGGSPVHENLHEPYDDDITFIGVAGINIRSLSVGIKDNGNTFDNCEYGVFADQVDALSVVENIFTDLTTVGAYVTESGEGDRDIDILDNTMNRMPYGIYCYDNPEAEIKIEGNNIDFTGMSSPPQYMTGITVEEITPGSPPSAPNKVSIHDNDITLAPCGIHAVNLAGYLVSPSTYIGNNTIYNQKTHNDVQAGILMENCTGVIVNENVISHNSKTGYEIGIRIGSGNSNWLFCNQVTDINKGLLFDNDQRPSTLLVKNKMTNNQTGIFLNYAKIGDQGSASQALDNEWIGTYTMFPNPHNPHTETYGNTADGVDSKFFVRNVSTSPPPTTLNPTANANTNGAPSAISTQIVTTAWSSGCPFTAPSYKTEEEQSPNLSDALSILNAEGEPQTVREASIRWAGEYGLYRQLLADETMRYADESLYAFFIDRDGGSMGQLHRAMTRFNQIRAAGGNDLESSEGEMQLSSIQPLDSESPVEHRLKEVLGILYSNLPDLTAISGNQETRLREIAQRCPLDDGLGVYVARSALLKLDTLPHHYINECERMPDSQSIESWKTPQVEPKEFSVYPNPSNGNMMLTYTLQEGEAGEVKIYDLLGNLVLSQQLNNEKTGQAINLSAVSSGVYLVRVFVNQEARLTQKVVTFIE